MYATYITGTAQNILSILRSGGPIVWSWGPHSLRAVTYNKMTALRFSVNGFIHKGDVIVAYNRGSDLYEIYILDSAGNVLASRKEVYFDELIEAIDRLVEKECPAAEYESQVNEWLAR